MAQHGLAAVGHEVLVELGRLVAHFLPVVHANGVAGKQRTLVVAAFIVEAEAALDLGVRLVQLARHAHGLVELYAVVGVEVFAVDDEL